MSTVNSCASYLLVLTLCSACVAQVAAPAEHESDGGRGTRIQLFADLGFRRGFLLSYPHSSKGRSVAATLRPEGAEEPPIWRLCQWGTKHTLAGVRATRGEYGEMVFENSMWVHWPMWGKISFQMF